VPISDYTVDTCLGAGWVISAGWQCWHEDTAATSSADAVSRDGHSTSLRR